MDAEDIDHFQGELHSFSETDEGKKCILMMIDLKRYVFDGIISGNLKAITGLSVVSTSHRVNHIL